MDKRQQKWNFSRTEGVLNQEEAEIPDAWLAVVLQLGEHLVKFDAGFKNLLRKPQVTVLMSQ